MKKLLVIGGTTHRDSINRAFAKYAGLQVPEAEITELDLNDFEMPIYSQDREEADGIPTNAGRFYEAIQSADGIVLSLAEHNGTYSAAFKNVLDWVSRHEQKLWSDKPMLLLATSPGGRGGVNVLTAAEQFFPHLGAKVAATFALPNFYENFSSENGITNPELKAKFDESLEAFIASGGRKDE